MVQTPNISVGTVILKGNTIRIGSDQPNVSAIGAYPITGDNVTVGSVLIESNILYMNSTQSGFFDLKNVDATVLTNPLIYKNFTVKNNTCIGSCKFIVNFAVQPSKAQIFKSVLFEGNLFDIDVLVGAYLVTMLDLPSGFEKVVFKGNSFNVKSVGVGSRVVVIAGYISDPAVIYGAFQFVKNRYAISEGLTFGFCNTVDGKRFLYVNEEVEMKPTYLQNIRKGVISDIWGGRKVFDNGSEVIVGAKTGSLTFGGDGTTTVKNVPHGLGVTPTFFQVIPANKESGEAGIKFVTANLTDLIVTFNTAPPPGTNNVKINWKVEV